MMRWRNPWRPRPSPHDVVDVAKWERWEPHGKGGVGGEMAEGLLVALAPIFVSAVPCEPLDKELHRAILDIANALRPMVDSVQPGQPALSAAMQETKHRLKALV